jgi:hypothetical protein
MYSKNNAFWKAYLILFSGKKAENHKFSWVSGIIHYLWTTCVSSTTSHTIGQGSSAGDTMKCATKMFEYIHQHVK